ncbi:MAG: zf-TFIIB domain-containing protein [Planctomycetes bacterium]|nr:zf-TFIIB domain-containing protein [Planctomycetota bacterium]
MSETDTGLGRSKKPLACPRCTVPFESIRIEDVAVDRCARCGGLWFDVNELDRVLAKGMNALKSVVPLPESAPPPAPAATPAAEGAGAPAPIPGAAPPTAPTVSPAAKLLCPVCAVLLMTIKTNQEPRFEVHACKVCYGRWVDSAEFHKLHEERPGFLGSILSLLEKWF